LDCLNANSSKQNRRVIKTFWCIIFGAYRYCKLN
jgi:hypothetical protein